MPSPTLPRIAIATGDPAGIGPEVSLKAALDAGVRQICRPLLVGDPATIELHAQACGLAPKLHIVGEVVAASWADGGINVLIAASGDRSADGEIRLWDTTTGKEAANLRVPLQTARSSTPFAVSPDGRTMAIEGLEEVRRARSVLTI